MPLSPATTLDSDHVTAKIDEGGMGEVYRARDIKLDRGAEDMRLNGKWSIRQETRWRDGVGQSSD